MATPGYAYINDREFICYGVDSSPDIPGSFAPEALERWVELILLDRDVFCSREQLIQYLTTQVHTADVLGSYNNRRIVARNAKLVGAVGEITWDTGQPLYSVRFVTGRNYVS